MFCLREYFNIWLNKNWNKTTISIGLVGAAAMRELHVIQGPNYAWSAWKIAFFAFHTFLVEDSRVEQKPRQGNF